MHSLTNLLTTKLCRRLDYNGSDNLSGVARRAHLDNRALSNPNFCQQVKAKGHDLQISLGLEGTAALSGSTQSAVQQYLILMVPQCKALTSGRFQTNTLSKGLSQPDDEHC